MCFCEYVGNGVKDLICAPRPMGHPKGSKTKLLLSEKSGRDDAKVHSLVSSDAARLSKLPRQFTFLRLDSPMDNKILLTFQYVSIWSLKCITNLYHPLV